MESDYPISILIFTEFENTFWFQKFHKFKKFRIFEIYTKILFFFLEIFIYFS